MLENLMFFCGSGTSFPSKLPDVTTITNKLLNDKWFEHTDTNFYSGGNPSDILNSMDITPRVQEFLLVLKEFADPYLIKRRNISASYEDIFYMCQQIEDNELLEIDNPLIEAFVNQLDAKLGQLGLYSHISPIHEKITIKYLANRAIALIQSVVWDSLTTNRSPIGLDAIIELQEQVEHLDVATLNHDLLIERVFNENGIIFCDGFGEPEGDIRYFDSSLYLDSNKINLYKLHGSINWYRFRIEINNLPTDRYGMATGTDHFHLKHKDNSYATNLNTIPMFLTGSYNKMLDYNFGIYRSIHSKFDQTLEKTNTILMSGYGWNDRGINGRLFDWLSQSRKNRLILLHERPIELKQNSKSALWHKYDNLVNEGRLVPIEKWLSDFKFSDIKNYL